MGEIILTGSEDMAKIYIKNQPQNPEMYIGLFTNDIDPALINNAEFADLIEPTATTYARQVLVPINWSVYGEVSVYPQIEFEVALEPFGIIYGCFIATSIDASGKLLAVHKFATPGNLLYYGDIIRLTPKFTIT